MNTVKWEGVATANSSIVHGAQALGTVTYLRREKFLLADGSIEEIPVISGNAWRGILRDLAADMWWQEVGKPKLTLPVIHALWSGGALAKISGPVLTGSRLASLRKAVPVVGIFGTAGGGRIIDGCLQVGKMIPICEETKHLIPKHILEPLHIKSIWDLTQVEYYSRVPSSNKLEFDTTDATVDQEMTPMRYGVESFIAGTQFYTWCSLTWPTEVELGFFKSVLEKYGQNTLVGGMSRSGHGRISLDLKQVSPRDVAKGKAWVSSPDLSLEQLLEMLSWLD